MLWEKEMRWGQLGELERWMRHHLLAKVVPGPLGTRQGWDYTNPTSSVRSLAVCRLISAVRSPGSALQDGM